MPQSTREVDLYLKDGCGRCPNHATPACKVKRWPRELEALRGIVLESDLEEERKWGVPCYTFENKNVLILSAFKEYCSISFFKGSLMSDPESVLIAQTKNMQGTRQIRFTHPDDVKRLKPTILRYIKEAIEIEKSGLKVAYKKVEDYPIPEEFQDALDRDPALQMAFEAITPGRRKGYLLHFAGAKQSKTRVARIDKCIPMIFDGVGLHDRY